MIKEMNNAIKIILETAKNLTISETVSEEHKEEIRTILKNYDKNKKTDQTKNKFVEEIGIIFKDILE